MATLNTINDGNLNSEQDFPKIKIVVAKLFASIRFLVTNETVNAYYNTFTAPFFDKFSEETDEYFVKLQNSTDLFDVEGQKKKLHKNKRREAARKKKYSRNYE